MALHWYSACARTRPVLQEDRCQSGHNPQGTVAALGVPCTTSLLNLAASLHGLKKRETPKGLSPWHAASTLRQSRSLNADRSRSHAPAKQPDREHITVDKSASVHGHSTVRQSLSLPGGKERKKEIRFEFVYWCWRSCQTASRALVGLASCAAACAISAGVVSSSVSGQRPPISMVASVNSGQGWCS